MIRFPLLIIVLLLAAAWLVGSTIIRLLKIIEIFSIGAIIVLFAGMMYSLRRQAN